MGPLDGAGHDVEHDVRELLRAHTDEARAMAEHRRIEIRTYRVIYEIFDDLKKAIDMQMNEGKTTVIEIMCTRELGDPFRRDALSKPVRFLDKYKDYV